MKALQITTVFFAFLSLTACKNNENDFDASGIFEAVETLISAEANGKVLAFNIKEGQVLKASQIVGYIDSIQLHLQKLQLQQNKKAILSSKPTTKIQTKALKEQLMNAKKDRNRMANLVKNGVANQKQLDDATAQIATLEAKINAKESSLNTTNTSITEQANLVDVQLQIIKDKIERSKITNPIYGTVLSTYVEKYELTSVGRPLYRIANMSTMTLRAYITGDQFTQVKIGQKVTVLTDDGNESYKETEGTILWINDKAEFTPKSIHTKNERANLVYAIKVSVPNTDGIYKIGMYGQIKF